MLEPAGVVGVKGWQEHTHTHTHSHAPPHTHHTLVGGGGVGGEKFAFRCPSTCGWRGRVWRPFPRSRDTLVSYLIDHTELIQPEKVGNFLFILKICKKIKCSWKWLSRVGGKAASHAVRSRNSTPHLNILSQGHTFITGLFRPVTPYILSASFFYPCISFPAL